MNHTRLNLIVLPSLVLWAIGCQAARTAGHKVGQAAVAVPVFIAKGVITGIFDSDETILERDHRERHERKWKQHWR